MANKISAPAVRDHAIFRKVAADIVARIDAGQYPVGSPLPSVRNIAEQYGIAPLTAHRVIRHLHTTSRVNTVRGVGSFVRNERPLDRLVLVTEFAHLHDRLHRSGLADAMRGMKEACSEAKLPLLTACERDDPGEYLQGRSGFVLFLQHNTILAPWISAILLSQAPYAVVGFPCGLPRFVDRDLCAAARMGLKYLYDLGHRQVLLIPRRLMSGEPILSPVTPEGANGLRVSLRPVPTVPAPRDHEVIALVQGIVREEIARPPEERPTAIYVGTQLVVLAALQALAEVGIRVPEMCSVLGFCPAGYFTRDGRQITRVDSGFAKMGRRAVEEVARTASGQSTTWPVVVELEFVEGETCAPFKA